MKFPDSVPARLAFSLVIGLVLAFPFFLVEIPPITDLPQHMNQARLLLGEGWANDSVYRINLFTPYLLGYAIIVPLLAVFEPLLATTASMIALCLLWAYTVIGSDYRKVGPGAVLALGFFYNQTMYWGFYHHIVGFFVFVLFINLLQRYDSKWAWFGKIALVGNALFFAHIYWFVFTLAHLSLRFALFPGERRITFRASLAMLPVFLLSIGWLITSSQEPFSDYLWLLKPWERFALGPLVGSILGGIKNRVESAYLIVTLFICILTGIYSWRNRLQNGVSDKENGWLWNKDLILAAGLCIALAFCLPDGNSQSTLIAARWMPFGFVFLLIGLPRIPASFRSWRFVSMMGISLMMVSVLVFTTASIWRKAEQVEYSGLTTALDQLPEKPALLGLSYFPNSNYIRGFPFVHTVAYGQLLHGGRINSSFTSVQFCPVVFRAFKQPWNAGLEMFPERLQVSDLKHFSYVLIAAPEIQHEAITSDYDLVPETHSGRWRLYSVRD